MDALLILRCAKAAGLQVKADGDKLQIRGPRRAEPVVQLLAEHKAAVLTVLASVTGTLETADRDKADDARLWGDRLASRIVDWFHGDRGWQQARRLAWGDVVNEWHRLYGRRWPAWQCAGCEAPIGGLQAQDLPDGNRVHFEPVDCAIQFGKRWRGAARRS